jgi:hypothetical protein
MTIVIPVFGQNWERGSQYAIPVETNDLNALVRKWVRGSHFKTLGCLIPHTSVIEVYLRDERISEADRREPNYRLGPGIDILQTDDEAGMHYRFHLWGQFTVYASVWDLSYIEAERVEHGEELHTEETGPTLTPSKMLPE